MLKILKSLLVIAAVLGIGGYVTYSQYIGTEKTNQLVLGAESFDLNVLFNGNNISQMAAGRIGEVGPGDEGKYNFQVQNDSIYDGNLRMSVTGVIDLENGRSAQELPFDNDAEGDLCGSVYVSIYDNGGPRIVGPLALNNFSNRDLGNVVHETTQNYKVGYEVPFSVDNKILSDECKFNVEFTLNQLDPNP